ncbi:MAG TPA: flagellar basal body-associated FliL family protein [Acetobacteraceae bacterium]|jgi:flagellar protein FliL|nr:flagellar basal body-associated FliL family protein [Acetobacteraceae bacterium]
MAVEAATVRPDAEGEAEEAPSAAPSSGRRRRWLLLAAPLLLGLAGAGLWFSGVLPRRLGLAHKGATASTAAPVTFAMPDMVANLAGEGDSDHYVKAEIRLVLANSSAIPVVRSHLPELQDLFLTYLRDMHASELESSIGTWRLREELLSRAAIAVGPGRVTDILFTNLLIQ